MELATGLQTSTRLVLAGVFFAISVVFVLRSVYGMRIESGIKSDASAPAKAA